MAYTLDALASDMKKVLSQGQTPAQLEQTRQLVEKALQDQGLAGWLAVSSGDYWSSRPVELLVVRPLAELPGATWEAAREAFLATRKAASAR